MSGLLHKCEDGPADAIHLASVQPVRLGMPELCRAGLSETWLWKAAGHRHWLALAAAYGLERPDFRDAQGARLYPAFTDVRLEGGGLDVAAEHAVLDFEVTLSRVSRTRFRSRIAVRSAGAVLATMIMESTFVRRAVEGSNRSATRGLVARPSRLLPPAVPEAPFRAASWSEAHGFRRSDRKGLAAVLLDPSPHEDFNGADFLYFAAFQAMLDRAEWAWFRRIDPLMTTEERHIAYAGNVELGDRVRATLCGLIEEGDGFATWVELHRESDGAQIAAGFTKRRAVVQSGPGSGVGARASTGSA